ncbi:hypothetical protein NKJ13_08190 [Mesorhizobium sp. M0174]|uniref:DUF7736 domain-containing protein n=1 Tax=Mesorhizobium sp. M0174 TaxID=2956904 RepID=UPI00333C501E
MTTKEFPTRDVLSTITGILMGPIGGVYEVLNFMTGEDVKPAIDAARRSIAALLNIANDPDQVKSRVAFAARCNEVK